MKVCPSRVNWNYPRRPNLRRGIPGNLTVQVGQYGLRAKEAGFLTFNQIEAARKVIRRVIGKKEATVKINVFTNISRSKKPLEVRMGSGKGSIDKWVAKVLCRKIIFEIGGVSPETAREAFRKAGHKLPIACETVKKGEE